MAQGDLSPGDFILALNPLCHQSPHAILRYENINPHCYFSGRPTSGRRLGCARIGKGLMYSNACKVVDGTIEIAREAPAEKQGLLDLLR